MLRKALVLIVLVIFGTCSIVAGIEDNNTDSYIISEMDVSGNMIISAEPDRGDVFDFPTVSDTWQVSSYPYWWHVGDTVYGNYTTTGAIDHVDISIVLIYNSLSGGGHCDFEFRIDGTVVGTFMITEASGMGPIMESFDFTEIPAGTIELRYYETNQVAGGLGSISISEASGTNSVSFTGPTSLELTTWGGIKAAL